jgi:hypothetical protein
MRIIAAAALSNFAHERFESISDFVIVVRNLIKDVRDSYRPELHYMRGPGPKWRAKHQPLLRFDSETALPTRRVPQGVVVPAQLSRNTNAKSAESFRSRPA